MGKHREDKMAYGCSQLGSLSALTRHEFCVFRAQISFPNPELHQAPGPCSVISTFIKE